MDIKEYISSGIIEMYVMGLCSPEEKKELEQLRSLHPELDKAIIEYEIALEKNMLQQTTLPGDVTDKKILETFGNMNKPAKLIPIYPVKRSWLKPFAIAASLLLLVSAGFNYFLYRQTKKQIVTAKTTTLPESDYQVMKNPGITPIAMYGVGSHAICRCTMFWDKNTGKIYIMIHHLPKSSKAKDYQLWATVNGAPVSIGIIQDDIRGRFIELDSVPSGALAFSVTLEKSGGSSSPTIDEIYLKGSI
jgi:hypothetical protein